MKEIDMKQWERREHYQFFSASDLPFYSVNFEIEITGLKEKTTSLGISINNALIFLTVRSLNQIENFLYRVQQGRIVRHDKIHPSFACLKENEELFRFITVDFHEDVRMMDKTIKEEIRNSESYFNLDKVKGRNDFVFLSSLPWIPFNAISHTMNLDKEDAIPRIAWGKFFERNGQIFLPYNIQVNHAFVDGIHVGRFYETLQNQVRELIKAF
jgi:chloramphenicol O-acetyltransferase type A